MKKLTESIYEQIERLIKYEKFRKRMIPATMLLSVIVAIIVSLMLMKPAITVTKENPEISVEFTNVDIGETIPLSVRATGTNTVSCFTLTLYGEGAGLTDEYFFEDEKTEITDNNGKTIELNREIGGDGAVNYYFNLDNGETTEFVLKCVSGVFDLTVSDDDYYENLTYIDEDGNEISPSDEEIAEMKQAELDSKISELETATLNITPGAGADLEEAKLDTVNRDTMNLQWDESSTEADSSSGSGIMLLSSSKIEELNGGAILDPSTGEDTGLTWSYTKNTLTGKKTLTISGEGAIPDYTSTTNVPWYGIANGSSGADNIVIEDGITRIGNYSFEDFYNATSLTIGKNVESIGRHAFQNCKALTHIEIPGSVKTIDYEAFANCTKLEEVTLNEGLVSFNGRAFEYTKISVINIPSTVTSIINSITYNITTLKEITVTEGNTVYYAENGVLYKHLSNGTSELVAYPPAKTDTEYIFPDDVTSIGDYAFSYQKYLRKITIPGTISQFNQGNEFYASALEEIVFEEGVSISSTYAFNSCTNLKRVILSDNSFSNTYYFRFQSCSSLEELYIPSGAFTIFGSATSNINLQRVYYNVKGTSTTSFQKGTETANKYELTIGNAVDRLYAKPYSLWEDKANTFRQNVLLNAGSVLFDGENQITIDDGVFDDMPAPLNALSGTVWVDSQGVVYKYDATTLTASVAYVPYGLTSVTIPETITPEDGVICTVNSVDMYAFRLAEDLETLTFENPEVIESIATYGIAYCSNLSEVNGVTTVEEATALFTNENVSIGYLPFYNTALGSLSGNGADQTFIDGNKELEVSKGDTQPMYISIRDDGTLWTSETDIGRYEALTGEVLSVNMSAGESDVESSYIYRVYFETSGLDASASISPGDTVTMNGTEMTCYATDAPNIMYIEFTPQLGTTVNVSVEFTYPSPSSVGGALRVWGMLLPYEESEANQGKIIECKTVEADEENEAYTIALQAEWTTEADVFAATKTSSGKTSIALTGDGNGNVTVGSDLSYKIVYANTSSDATSYGSDYVKTVDFYDYIDFSECEGVSWSEEVLENIKNGNTRYVSGTYYAGTTGTFYAGNTAIANVSNSGAALSGGSLEYDEERGVVLHWKIYNASTTAEIATTTTTLTVYEAAVSVDNSLLNAEAGTTYEFTNNVESVTHYTYSDDRTSTSSALKYFTLSAGTIGISKTSVSNVYLGGTIDYTIRVYNSNAMTYWGDEGAVYTVKDVLDTKTYIKPDEMELMFNDEYGKDLTITISNAVISQWSEVTSTDGGSAYINAANSDDIESSTDTFTISWNSDKTALQIKRSDGTILTVNNSLKETLQEIGYTVASTTAFTAVWTLNDENTVFSLTGGQSEYFYIYANLKDTFQMLTADNPNCYPTESMTNYYRNNVYVYKSTSTTAVKSTYVYNNMKREAYIYKSVYLNSTGEVLTENNVQPGDVLDYCVEFDHYGNGSYENLPLVDNLYGAQVLLVPADENPSLAEKGLETYELNGVTYYKLSQSGTYNDIVVGIDESGNYLVADTVTVTGSETSTDAVIGNDTYSYTGLYTQMKLYYTQTEDDYFYTELNYHTLIDSDLLNATNYDIGSIVYMNDNTGDRIYDSIWSSSSLLNFDKEIVTQNEDGTYTADADDYTVIGAGEDVTYRLTLKNPNSYTLTLDGNDFYDYLPTTYGIFNWEKDVNVSLSYEEGENAQLTNFNEWYVDATDGNLAYIRWQSDTEIRIAPENEFEIYVTLTYPTDTEDNETYSQYCEAVGGNKIENSLYVYGYPVTVYHSLKEKGSALLQKGVYATYRYTTGSVYTQTASRTYYNNTDSTGRAVSYYVVLYNDGNSRLYLQNIYDELPQGFTYSRLMNSTSVSTSAISTLITPTSNPFANITLGDDESVSYKAATVTASASNGIITFNISNGGTSGSAIKYDETENKYYLEKGEAIVFGYVCNIGSTTETVDNAVNAIGMQYYDYLDAGVKVASKSDVTVEGKITSMYSEQNDGSISIKYTEDIGDEYSFAGNGYDGEQWLLSDVTINRGEIIPGVTCYTDSYVDSGSSDAKTYTTSVSPFATINWRARLHNSGTNSITDYTFVDVLPSPYGLTGTVSMNIYDSTSTSAVASYNIFTVSERNDDDGSITIKSSYSGASYKLPLDGTAVTITVASEVTVNVSLTRENNQETLKIVFADKIFSIPENGGYVDIALSSKNVTTDYNNSVYTNYAYLIPNVQEYTSAAQGSLVYEGEEVAGVLNTSPATVSIGYSTSSIKTVEEINNSDNSTNSSEDKKYIILGNKNSEFRYTLTVTNDTTYGMTKLILIDSLPQVGDHSPFDKNAARLSEFTVSLAENPEFTVTVITSAGNSYQLSQEYYTIGYTATEEFTSDDWSGISEWSEWTEGAEDVRSLRLYIRDADGTQIPAGAKVEFSFNAKVDDEKAVAGMTAWNSFGYHYGLTGISYELEAMPLQVGVKIPDLPVLQKKLVDLTGNEYKAEEAGTFSFMLYTGDEIQGDYSDIKKFTEALEAENRSYRKIELTVEEGKSASEKLKLELNDWTWTEGESYTIAEIQDKEYYKLSGWNNRSMQSVTFAYDPDVSTALTCTNVWQKWWFEVLKVDGVDNNTLLSGAVFAIYSSESSDLISEEEYSALTCRPEKTIEGSDGTVWYLCEVKTTGTNGIISFENLTEESYYLVEVKSPDGYKLDWQSRIVDSTSMTKQIKVENFSMTQLPFTGGSGMNLLLATGFLLVGISLFILVFKWRRNVKYR